MIPSIQNIDSMGNFRQLPLVSDTVRQGVNIFDKLGSNLQNDTASALVSVVDKPATGHFLQQTSITLNLINHPHNLSGLLTVFILGISFMITLIWYFFPERILRLLSKEGSKHKSKYSDSQFAKPGILLYTLLFITFISTIATFIYLLLKVYAPEFVANYPFQKLVIGILVLITSYYIARLVIIFLTGYLFKTSNLVLEQLRANFRIDLIQSFILLPILVIMLNYQITYLYYLGLILLIIVVIYKWVITIDIGLKSINISVYHNILYLCALEIIPVIVLMKLLENYGLIFITG